MALEPLLDRFQILPIDRYAVTTQRYGARRQSRDRQRKAREREAVGLESRDGVERLAGAKTPVAADAVPHGPIPVHAVELPLVEDSFGLICIDHGGDLHPPRGRPLIKYEDAVPALQLRRPGDGK